MKQALRYNNKTVRKIYQGDELVKKMNCGQSSDVFQYLKKDGDAPKPYDEQYLTIEALTAGILEINLYDAVDNVFYYSRDKGVSWDVLTSQTIDANETVLLKCENPAANESHGIGKIIFNGQFNVYGNIMSLIYGDNFVGQTVIPNSYEFKSLFDALWIESYLISAENLILPATTLTDYCYQEMFYGCTSLTVAPELPATTLAESCYASMFHACTSLTTAPELPALRLASTSANDGGCYAYMFQGCTSLTTAPQLPAMTLANNCYQGMFNSCTSLTTAPQLPAMTLANNCYDSMFLNCISLTTAPELPATTLASNCYAGMFNSCIRLTTAPELPATTLTMNCYGSMFNSCKSLTTAPELPALNLTSGCYGSMFRNCTSLNSITCLATVISATQYTFNWVYGVGSSGTFVKAANVTWPTGSSGIPSGWTVVDA